MLPCPVMKDFTLKMKISILETMKKFVTKFALKFSFLKTQIKPLFAINLYNSDIKPLDVWFTMCFAVSGIR